MKDDHDNATRQGEIIIYQTEDGKTKLDVRFVEETVWLTQQQMAELFQSSRTNIVEHIHHIYEEGELEEQSTCRKFRQVRFEGNRQITREIPFYYLIDLIRIQFLQLLGIHTGLFPFERHSPFVVGRDELVYGPAELRDRFKAASLKRPARQDAEEDLHLV